MSDITENNGQTNPSNSQLSEEVDRILQDPSKRVQLFQRLGCGNPWFPPFFTPSGMSVGDGAADLTLNGTAAGSGTARLTPSGMAVGSGLVPTPPWMGAPFVVPPFAPWPYPSIMAPVAGGATLESRISHPESEVANSEIANSEIAAEDVVEPLSDTEAQEFEEFDPSTEPEGSWEPPAMMLSFLERHFNRSLPDKDKDNILTEFPRPDCPALVAPKLDGLVKEQLSRKGKDPQFGAERTLYKLQEQLLEVTGPLTCLWADIVNPDVELKAGEALRLLQRALVLLGNTLHGISLERRKIACSRINPKLKSIATEEFADRKDQLFGPGFLERASKKMETEKALWD